jgi:hypothetical protein
MYFWKINSSDRSTKYSILLLLLLLGCSPPPEKTSKYFSFDDILRQQAGKLSAGKAIVSKRAALDRITEDAARYTPKDSVEWIKELDIFRTLDVINKPVNINAYQVEDGLKDVNSNLKIKLISTKENLPVRYIKIFYQDKPENIRIIESKYTQSNFMFHSERILTLEFQDVHSTFLLTRYSVKGKQKMFLRDSISFSIQASVSLP